MSSPIDLKIVNKAIKNNLPEYSTSGSAGLDLRACIEDNIKLQANDTVLIPSGIAIHIKNKIFVVLSYLDLDLDISMVLS